jgi:cytochrome c oxidase assembly protein subunit 15
MAGWVSWVTEILIVGTGGAVRLTGSGLGCKWPLCAPDSLIPVAGMSFHAYVEFGNRLMSGVVGLAALAVLILVWRMRRERRDLFTMAWIVIGGIFLQALVGGITVLGNLDPDVIGFHFLASMTLIATTTAFLVRAYSRPGPRRYVVPRWHAVLAQIAAVLTVLTLLLGVVTSESGPHSGNAEVERHLFNPVVMAHVHSVPGYTLLAVAIALVVTAWPMRLPTLRWSIAVLLVLLAQVALGVYQARAGLPAIAVGVHMILAGLITAAMTVLLLRLREPVSEPVRPTRAA